MTTLWEAIILGLIQGITEWLPISSSGHSVLAQHLLNISEPVIFDVVLHFGSVLVILLVYWKDIVDLVTKSSQGDKQALRYVGFLVIASIPIALIGFFFNEQIKSAFDNVKVVGYSLIATALLLFLSRKPLLKPATIQGKNALLVGFAQALAILPGISRSGSTISVAMMLGIKKEEAAKFSFLMAIPAILGANLLEVGSIGEVTNLPFLVIATLVTIISGYLTLKLLLRIIKKNQFSNFGWYCLVVGLFILLIL